MFEKQAAMSISCPQAEWTPYTSVTRNLPQRIYQHKHDLAEGFTKKYCVHLSITNCTRRWKLPPPEKNKLNKWNRQWKQALIEKENPDWKDL